MENKMNDVVQKIMDIIKAELKEEKELNEAKKSLTEFMKMSKVTIEPNIYMANAIEAARKSLDDISNKPALGSDGIHKLMKLYILVNWIDEFDDIFKGTIFENIKKEDIENIIQRLYGKNTKGIHATYEWLKSKKLGSNSTVVEETTEEGIEIPDEIKKTTDNEDNRQVQITWLTEDGVPDYRYFACANGKILQYMNFTLTEKFPRKRRTHNTNSGELISSEVIVNLTPDKAYFVSHLIWEAFNPDFRNEEYELIHKDGDLRNCALSNLAVAYENED